MKQIPTDKSVTLFYIGIVLKLFVSFGGKVY